MISALHTHAEFQHYSFYFYSIRKRGFIVIHTRTKRFLLIRNLSLASSYISLNFVSSRRCKMSVKRGSAAVLENGILKWVIRFRRDVRNPFFLNSYLCPKMHSMKCVCAHHIHVCVNSKREKSVRLLFK